MAKVDVLHFIENTGKRYEDYHRRKETASWLALVLYMAIAFQVAGLEREHLRILLTSWQLVVAVTFFLYIRAQIGNRRVASLIVSACYEIEAILLGDDRAELPRADYPLGLATSGKRQVDFVLPEFLRQRAEAFKDKGGQPGRIMDISRYMIFGMSTLLAFVGIWTS